MARSELKKHTWFWTTLGVVILCHVPIVLFVPWTETWIPAFVIAPFCVADGVAILAVIQAVEKRVSNQKETLPR